MMYFKLLALFSLAILAQAQEQSDDSSKVVNGTDAGLGQIPYQASLRSALNNHFCGGSILNERWVISAAHCTIGRTTANTLVVVGTVSRLEGGLTYQTSSIVNHPEYNGAILENDISLVQTATTITYTENVTPIKMGIEYVGGDIDVRVSGWGQIFFPDGPAAEILQFLEMVTVETDYCRERYVDRELDHLVHESSICTQPEFGTGACHGDSGGPLINTNVLLIGVVSWGVSCAVGYPDVYTRVSSYIEWINGIIN